MAHGIYTDRDFQIALEQAWHNLTILKQPTREAFPEIVPMPLTYSIGNDVYPVIHGDKRYVSPVALDDGLPVAPPYCEGTYSLFTPRDAWDWAASILAGTQYDVQSIGMLWNRSNWFISVKLTELQNLSVGDGRETRFQLNLSGGLDRSMSPQGELSSTVVVCANTLSISRLTGKVLFHEKATKNFKSKLEAAKAQVEEAVGMSAVFKASMDSIAQNACDVNRARNVFAGFITPTDATRMSTRTRNTVDELTSLHVNGIGNRGQSEFDLLNAYTQLVTRGSEDSKISAGRRFAASEFGDGADRKADFARLLTEDRESLAKVEDRGSRLVMAN